MEEDAKDSLIAEAKGRRSTFDTAMLKCTFKGSEWDQDFLS